MYPYVSPGPLQETRGFQQSGDDAMARCDRGNEHAAVALAAEIDDEVGFGRPRVGKARTRIRERPAEPEVIAAREPRRADPELDVLALPRVEDGELQPLREMRAGPGRD